MSETNIKTSAEIKELVSALAKAQGEMRPAVFNKTNPHFRTKYADFTSCMEACRIPLSKNGLAIVQTCQTIDNRLVLVSMLAHVSGQWMTSEFPLISQKMDSQGIGSAMTYAKRYSLCGLLGIVADEEADDDGEAAMGRFAAFVPQAPKVEIISKKEAEELIDILSECDFDYREKVMSSLKKLEPSVSSFYDVPRKFYARILMSAKNRKQELATLKETPAEEKKMDEIDVILSDIDDKYGEWLEIVGDKAPTLKQRILVQMLLKSIEEKEFYEREFRRLWARTGNSGMA